MELEMIGEMIQEMIRQMQELKADMNREMQELKEYMQRLVRSSSADWKVNARPSLDQNKKSEEVEFKLQFANKLPDKILTRDKIRDESDGFVQIELIDTINGMIRNVDLEIEIVVLDGDFGSDRNENWTEHEFNAKILHQREGKEPLVKGKQNITLRKGVGIIDDLSFYDNSSWKECRKFRLGARVLQSRSRGQARIKEAVSQAFVVNDFRMRRYHEKRSQKLDLPSLDNDVSPLKKIKKNAKCHTDNNIHTVSDFKQMHRTEEVSCNNVDDEKLNAEQVVHQGLAGMQNDRNPASSSHDHKGGFSTAEEIVPDLASQPLATPTNGVSGRDSSQSNYNPLMTESSQINNGPHPNFPAAQHASNAFDDVRRNAYSNPLQSRWETEALNNPTTGPVPHEFPIPHQGLAGMQNDCNPASSSHDHNSGFSTAEEIVQNLASQPLATPTNGVCGRDISQSNYNPLMTESSQVNNGPHPHFPAAQHASNAFNDVRRNAYSNPLQSQWEAEVCNNPTTGLLPHEFPVPHQGLEGMQNNCNPASSSHDHNGGFSTAEEIVPNLASQPLATQTIGVSGRDSSQSNYNPLMTEFSQINNGPLPHFPAAQHASNAFDDVRRNAYSNPLQSQWEAEAFNNPTTGTVPHEFPVPHQGLGGMQNNCNPTSSSHDHKGGFSTADKIVPNLASQPLATPTNGVSGRDSSQSNYNPLMTESSQVNNGPHPHVLAAQHASNAFDDVRCNAYSNPLQSQWEAEAFNNLTTGLLPQELPVPHQGLVGMQNDCNPASSSHDHNGGFLTAEEIVQNLASQPLATPTNGVSGRDSSQSNYNPLMTESSQVNNGPHPHVLAAQHASNAFDDVRRNAYSNPLQSQWEAEAFNNLTTGLLPQELPVPRQGLVGMQNYCNPASSSHDHKGGFSTAEEIVLNLASQPLATPTNGVLGRDSSQSNYNPLMTVSSQINNSPHPHFPPAQHASNAFNDVRRNAYSNPLQSQREAEAFKGVYWFKMFLENLEK